MVTANELVGPVVADDKILAKLARAGGAILRSELIGTNGAWNFDYARERGVIGFDAETDGNPHPPAPRRDEGVPYEEGGSTWYEMPASPIQEQLRAAGFTIEGTGGGCTAWSLTLANGSYILVTDDDLSHNIRSGDKVTIGMYDNDGDLIAGGGCDDRAP